MNDDVPELTIGDSEAATLSLLRTLQRAALLHAEAARGLFNTFVAEGRAFAQTTEGARFRQQLVESRLVERATLVWQGATLWVTEDPNPSAVPSALVDAIAATAASPRRDPLLDELFRRAESD